MIMKNSWKIISFNSIKTVILLGFLSGLLLFFGRLVGGNEGMTYALIIAVIINGISYFYSDKIVLAMYGAKPLDQIKFSWIYDIVSELCNESGIPMPKLYFINTPMANAFATGRNPNHSAVAVTQGILDILEPHELRGVLAHEISHIKNRDILVGTIAATMAATIGYLADMIRWNIILSRNERDRSNAMAGFLVSLIIPFLAALIQLAVSRSREYLADESGAECSHDPLALASALEKLADRNNHYGKKEPESCAHAASAHLFIVNPFKGRSILNMLSTHPPVEERVKRLRKMAGIK